MNSAHLCTVAASSCHGPRWLPPAGAPGFTLVESSPVLILEGGSSDGHPRILLKRTPQHCGVISIGGAHTSVPVTGQYSVVLLWKAELRVFPPDDITEFHDGD